MDQQTRPIYDSTVKSEIDRKVAELLRNEWLQNKNGGSPSLARPEPDVNPSSPESEAKSLLMSR